MTSCLELNHHAHKVGVNVHHLEWCTKYRHKLLRQEKYKSLCEDSIRKVAARHGIGIRELGVQPEHVHVSAELPPSMSQSKALQLLKGGSSYLIRKEQPKFKIALQYSFWSSGGYAGSVGSNTIDAVDDYVRQQETVAMSYTKPSAGSPAL